MLAAASSNAKLAGVVATEPASGNRHVLGMRTERTLVVPEDAVAHLERGDATAHRFDHSSELGAGNPHLRLVSPEKNLMKKGLPARYPQSVRFTVVA